MRKEKLYLVLTCNDDCKSKYILFNDVTDVGETTYSPTKQSILSIIYTK